MIIEYVLLLAAFVMYFGATLWHAPGKSFKDSAPRLGARIERSLASGNGFKKGGGPESWISP
jgi:hypothetical protein